MNGNATVGGGTLLPELLIRGKLNVTRNVVTPKQFNSRDPITSQKQYLVHHSTQAVVLTCRSCSLEKLHRSGNVGHRE